MTIYILSLVVLIVGGLAFVLLTPPPYRPKVTELGKYAFILGLLIFLLRYTE